MKKLILGLILVFSLVGCSNDANNTSMSEDLNFDKTVTGTPVIGGEVTVAVTNEIDSLDPYMAVAAGTKEIMFNIYEGLVKYTPTGDIMPAVASSYVLSDDMKSYTFYLRDDIKFHNGNLVTTEDIVFSINKAIDKKSSFAFENIESVVSNDDSVTINLINVDTDLLPFLTASFVSIIPNNYENSKDVPIGTGPFKFLSYKAQEELIVEKFEDYWDSNKVYLDKVNFKLFADPNSAYLELLSGTVDMYTSVGVEHYDELKDSFNITLSYINMVQVLAFNNDVAPFDDIRVRQAINHIVDKDEIIQLQSNGYATKIGSAILPGFTKYYNEDLSTYYDVNVESAKELLAESGYPDGFTFTIKIPSNYDFHVKTGEIIAAQLEQIGITAKIELVEWGTWLDDVYMGRNYESTIIGLTGELSPRDWLSRYESTSSVNFMNFNSPAFDSKYNETLLNPESATTSVYMDLQKIITENAPAVFIQDTQLLNVMNKNIGGYESYPLYVIDMSTVHYLEDK